MDAKEIRERNWRKASRNDYAQVNVLVEIAAQLAEKNDLLRESNALIKESVELQKAGNAKQEAFQAEFLKGMEAK